MYRFYYFERLTQQFTYPLHSLTTTSPRKLLFFINFLLAMFSIALAGVAIFLCILLYDPGFTSGWINWFGMSVVSLLLTIVAILGMRGAHLVSFEILLTYFWLIIICSLPFVLGLFACFNYNIYTKIWFKHSWDLPNFRGVRNIFCKVDTADSKCLAPPSNTTALLISTDYTSWCQSLYNATDCSEIRNSAIDRAVEWGSTIITVQSFIGLIGLFIIAWSIYFSHQILTGTVITQSMLDVINYLLILPICGCVAMTIYFWWIQDLPEFQNAWFPRLFLALAVAQVVALPLGIFSGRWKSRFMLSTYIGLMILIALGFAASAGIQWTLAGFVVNGYAPSRDLIYDMACRKYLPGCSGCNNLPPTCTEWSSSDILTLFSLDLRLTGMVSTVSILYIVGGLIVAFLVDNSLKNYKWDFI